MRVLGSACLGLLMEGSAGRVDERACMACGLSGKRFCGAKGEKMLDDALFLVELSTACELRVPP